MQEQDARAIAESVARDLCREDYEAVSARFHPEMAKGLPLSQLARVSKRELGAHGALRSATSVAERRGEHVATVVRCEFDSGAHEVHVLLNEGSRIVGLYLQRAPGVPSGAGSLRRARAQLAIMAPLVVSAAVAIAFLLRAQGGRLVANAVIVGTFGWGLALALRAPLAIAARRVREKQAQLIALAADPLQEIVRLMAIGLAGTTFSDAFSLGLGWALLDLVFLLAAAIGSVRRSSGLTPEQSELAVHVDVLQGAWAPGFHVGATLLVAHSPLFFLLTAAAGVVRSVALARSRARCSHLEILIVSAASAAVFLGGLAAYGRLT